MSLGQNLKVVAFCAVNGVVAMQTSNFKFKVKYGAEAYKECTSIPKRDFWKFVVGFQDVLGSKREIKVAAGNLDESKPDGGLVDALKQLGKSSTFKGLINKADQRRMDQLQSCIIQSKKGNSKYGFKKGSNFKGYLTWLMKDLGYEWQTPRCPLSYLGHRTIKGIQQTIKYTGLLINNKQRKSPEIGLKRPQFGVGSDEWIKGTKRGMTYFFVRNAVRGIFDNKQAYEWANEFIFTSYRESVKETKPSEKATFWKKEVEKWQKKKQCYEEQVQLLKNELQKKEGEWKKFVDFWGIDKSLAKEAYSEAERLCDKHLKKIQEEYIDPAKKKCDEYRKTLAKNINKKLRNARYKLVLLGNKK